MAKKKFPVGRIILILILILFFGIQFFGINRSVPQTDPSEDLMAITDPPSEIQALIHDACYDCHSYQTEYPWYSYVQPVSWFLQNHIDEAREHMNFSEWGEYSKDQQQSKFKHSGGMVAKEKMPLKSFKIEHPEARLTDEEIKMLSNWFLERSK